MVRPDHKKILADENRVAQLHIMRDDLEEVTAALSKKLEEKTLLDTQVESLRAESVRLLELNAKTSRNTSNRLTAVLDAQKELDAREEAITAREGSSNEAIQFAESNSKSRIQQTEALIGANLLKIEEHNVTLSGLSTIKEGLILEIDKLNLTANDISGKIQEHQDVFNKAKRSSETELEILKKNISIAKANLAEVRLQVLTEQEKVRAPQMALEVENKKLIQRREDLDIYRSRINKRWQQLFPGKPLNI